MWEDVRSAYEAYLGMYPKRRAARAAFAKRAVETGNWADARRHLTVLGDDPPREVFPGPADYARVREKAALESGAAVEDVLKKVKPSDAPVPF